MPDPAHLKKLAALVVLLPTLWTFGVGGPGSFSMFTQPSEARLSLLVRRRSGWRQVHAGEVRGHLGSDARRVILPALRGAITLEVHRALLEDSLPELAELACRVTPAASSIALMQVDGTPTARVEVACR